MFCKICNKEFSSSSVLSRHITKIHNIEKQEYYDKYLKSNEDGICKTCRKATKFKNIVDGYFDYCCVKCAQNSKETIEKRENTTMQKYGSKNIRNTEYYVEKTKSTKIEKYNDETYNNRNKAKLTCLKKYGVETPLQSKDIEQKRDKTNMSLFGSEKFKSNMINKHGTDKYRNNNKAQETCLKKYGVKNPFQSDEIKDKIKQTNVEKYGVENISLLNTTTEKRKNTNLQKYGIDWPFLHSNVGTCKYTYDNEYFDSSWELIYYIWLTDHNVKFRYHPDKYFSYIHNDKEHKYYPDFLVNDTFVEIKGLQFFENCNIENNMINPYDRSLDEVYEAKHKCMLANNVKIITNIDEYEKYVNEKYTSDYVKLFKNDLQFPYLNADLANTSDFGLIQHFHKSIYNANRENRLSPIKAWEDKNLIRKCALNRLKYIGRCRPNDILQGFNVTKIAPKVSVFKPDLAKLLITKYLQKYSTIVDPFSGFSGRMLGAVACGKKYIGYDINEIHVKESQEIIKYKQINNIIVTIEDLISAPTRTYVNAALFTCSPYASKEHWLEDKVEIEKSCDEWIDLCIEKHKCDKYLFVVDKTEKYKNNIVETIENKSHFGNNTEYVLLL